MRRLIFVLLLSTSCFSQTQEARIFFHDGDSLDGYGALVRRVITPFTYRVDVKFRLTTNAKPDLWTSDDLKRIVFFGDGMTRTFEFKKFGKHALNADLIELLVEGKVTLFAKTAWKTGVADHQTIDFLELPIFNVENAISTMAGYAEVDEEKMKYFLRRSPDEEPFAVGTPVKSWARCAIEYFADCPWLVKKIKNHEFLKSQMKEVVENYNDICGAAE